MKKIYFPVLLQFFTAVSFSQNVGIGETLPTAAKLHVKAADSAVVVLENSTGSGVDVRTGLFFKTAGSYSGSISTIGTSYTHRMGLFTYGGTSQSALLERLSILDGGNVGIGTTTPGAKLEVNGQIKLTGGNPGAGKILESDAFGLASWVDKPSGGSLPSGVSGNTLRHNGSSYISTANLYNDGSRIGINTTSPGSLMEIKSISGTADLELNASAGNNAVLRLTRSSNSTAAAVRFRSGNTLQWDMGNFSDNIFKIIHVPGNSTVFSIDDASRNVGIGTNDYSNALNVGGNIGAAGAVISKQTVNGGFLFEDRSANAYGGWAWYADAGKANLFRYGGLGNAVTVDATGKMGLGLTTPTSPLSFPASLGKKISLYPGTTGDAGLSVFGNEFRIHSDYNGADITFGYDNFTNGFTERVRMKANGNVGIGTNAPAYLMDVNGRMRLRHNGASSGVWFNSSTNTEASFIGQYTNNLWGIFTGGAWKFAVNATDGSVMLGSNNLDGEVLTNASGYKLKVFGKIIGEEVRVQLKSAWPDYVFADDYSLRPLAEVEQFIKYNKHLPNIPSAAEVQQDGQMLGEIQSKLVEKVEELTLYIIDLKKEIEQLKKQVNKAN